MPSWRFWRVVVKLDDKASGGKEKIKTKQGKIGMTLLR